MLNISRRISLFLTMLMLIQSVVVSADVHPVHQTEKMAPELAHNASALAHDHGDPDHVHGAATHADVSDHHSDHLPQSDYSQDDCQHCCHCHPTTSAYLAGSTSTVFPERFSSVVIYSDYRFVSFTPEPALRPPIS